MLLIPAIDLKGGRCVQLRQGVMDSATEYSDDPPDMARRWLDLGARRLHVVDLDGAFAGRPVNQRWVEAIVRAAGDVPVQVGGGVRAAQAALAYLEAGASQVIVGTRAVEEPGFLGALAERWPGKIILGLDARYGKAATRGWTETSGAGDVELVGALAEVDVFAVVYTDIVRDGTLRGVNVDAMRRLAAVSPVPVIASGGVRNLADLRALKALGDDLLLGAISGSALYEGTLDFSAGQGILNGLG